MSQGIVGCSLCGRELHQDGDKEPPHGRRSWRHCEDKTPICPKAIAIYVHGDKLRGKYCGKDGALLEEVDHG